MTPPDTKADSRVETYPALESVAGLIHGFVLRHPEIPVDTVREAALDRLRPHYESTLAAHANIAFERLWTGEQVHGDRISLCASGGRSERRMLSGTDGLITGQSGEFLGVYVADCCAVFLVDPARRACGLVHSGKNGSALGIAPRAIRRMAREFGSDPAGMIVQLSPCIRPPAYEIDFAAQIRKGCEEAGVPPKQIHDSGVCTSCDLERYYSYRAERGKTGRMLSLIGWRKEKTPNPE